MKLFLLLILSLFVAKHTCIFGNILPDFIFTDRVFLGSGSIAVAAGTYAEEYPNDELYIIEEGFDPRGDIRSIVPTINSVITAFPAQSSIVKNHISDDPTTPDGYNSYVTPSALSGANGVSGSFEGLPGVEYWDEIVSITGDPSYSFSSIRQIFNTVFNYDPSQSNSTNNGNGPIDITILNPNDPVIAPYAAAQSLVFGIPVQTNYDEGNQEIIGPMHRTLKRSNDCTPISGPCTRSTAFTSYVEPLMNSLDNINVLTNTTALKLIWGKFGFNKDKVIGVEVYHNGDVTKIYTKKGVFVGLGPVGTPKFLQLSGIGERTHLENNDIEVRHELPGVGEGFTDHSVYAAVYLLLGQPVALPSTVFISFQKSGFNGNSIDIEVAYTILPANEFASIMLIVINQLRNTGVGFARVQSPNAFIEIESQFGWNVANFAPMAQALNLTRQWMSFSPLNIPVSPTEEELSFSATFSEYLAFIYAEGSQSYFHPTGTARMGQPSDPMAVVDSNCKVIGVDKLWVMDTSIFPVPPSTHPSASGYTVARKCALADINA